MQEIDELKNSGEPVYQMAYALEKFGRAGYSLCQYRYHYRPYRPSLWERFANWLHDMKEWNDAVDYVIKKDNETRPIMEDIARNLDKIHRNLNG